MGPRREKARSPMGQGATVYMLDFKVPEFVGRSCLVTSTRRGL
jgi:hypothetical protein